jgi:hypothetical protein
MDRYPFHISSNLHENLEIPKTTAPGRFSPDSRVLAEVTLVQHHLVLRTFLLFSFFLAAAASHISTGVCGLSFPEMEIVLLLHHIPSAGMPRGYLFGYT